MQYHAGTTEENGFSSGVAFTARGHLIVSTTPAVVGSSDGVTPVAAVTGWALPGETLSSTQLAGMRGVLATIAIPGGCWPRRAISPA